MKVLMDRDKIQFFKQFGQVVRTLRQKRAWTLEDMIDHGFSAQHFQKIEKGNKEISLYTASRIAKAFRMNLSKLFKLFD